jgi:hypothetical protein
MKAMVSGVPYPVELDDPRITDQELQEIVLAVMTSGMRQKGRPVQFTRVHAHGDRQTLF